MRRCHDLVSRSRRIRGLILAGMLTVSGHNQSWQNEQFGLAICSKAAKSDLHLQENYEFPQPSRLKISIYSDSTKKRRDSTRSIFSCNLPFANAKTGPDFPFRCERRNRYHVKLIGEGTSNEETSCNSSYRWWRSFWACWSGLRRRALRRSDDGRNELGISRAYGQCRQGNPRRRLWL